MLMSNTCHPSVLNLLPFSSNDASDTKGPETLESLYPPEHVRVFPVLAVTRRRKDERVTAPGARAAAMLGSPHDSSRPPRASSERLSRDQIMAGELPTVGRPRVKSEYDLLRTAAPSGGGTDSLGAPAPSRDRDSWRDPATCSITNINERIMTCRTNLAAEVHSSSQGTRTRKQDHVSHILEPTDSPFLAAGAPGWTLPKPSLTSGMVAFVADSVDNGELEAKHPLLLRNGLRRSLTLTPGELDLMKHRGSSKGHQAYQAGSRKAPGSGKSPEPYKLNVRDLPRSTTPLTDHDPDRLNMKHVIAFLQSKGASVAEAVQLPTDNPDEERSTPAVRVPPKAGVARGGLRKTSTGMPLGTEAPARNADTGSLSPSSRRVEDGDQQGFRTGASGASPKSYKDKQASKPHHVHPRDASCSAGDDLSPRKRPQQQRPFRLHRFLTMVPAPNDTSLGAPGSVENSRTPRRGPVVSHSPKPLPEEKEKRINFNTRSCLTLPDVDSSATCVSSSDMKYAYRLPSYGLGSHNTKKSADPPEDVLVSASADDMKDICEDDFFDDRNAIRLPNVLAESDEEDPSADEHKHISSAQRRNVTKADSQTSAKKTYGKKIFPNSRSEHRPDLSGQQGLALNEGLAAALNLSSGKLDLGNKHQNASFFQDSPGSDLTHAPENREENVFPDVGLEKTKAPSTKQVRVKLPSEAADEDRAVIRKHPPAVVTLSLRKERTRTRELTYMSEMAGNEVLSDVAHVGANDVRLSIRRDDVISSAI